MTNETSFASHDDDSYCSYISVYKIYIYIFYTAKCTWQMPVLFAVYTQMNDDDDDGGEVDDKNNNNGPYRPLLPATADCTTVKHFRN